MSPSPYPRPTTTRRSVLRGGLAAAGLGALSACGSQVAPMPKVRPGQDLWRRFAGTTINFISENTAPTAAIAANLAPFERLTGIKVQIVNLELTALVQRVALDMASGDAQYQVVYADPYQVLAPYSKGLADLREFIGHDGYPQVPNGVDDFIPTQLDAAGRFEQEQPIYALPYDCPTMVWQYRKDLFDKHHDAMSNDLGFDATPGIERTWEQYYAIAKWLNDNADEVPFGAGQQAKQHDSLMCDFSNVLWAYGGDYFDHGQQLGRLGVTDPGRCRLDSDQALAATELYAKLSRVAHPGSRTWDWDGVGAAFRAGQIAMTPNWHEFAAANEQALPGKVGYAPLPHGPARSANHYGGTGIGIADNAKGAARGAAWLFVCWATAPKTQLADLSSKAGGGTPTRTSVYQRPEVRRAEHHPSKLPNMLSGPAVAVAWKPENIGLRPKIPMWNACDTAIFTELSKMLAHQQGPEQTMRTLTDRIDSVVDRGWVA